MDLSDRISELIKYFGVYGYGNFDLYPKDIEKLIQILIGSENYKEEIKKLYEQLELERMG